MSIFSKARAAAQKYVSNVVGGAKIVGGAMGNAFPRGSSNQAASVIMSQTPTTQSLSALNQAIGQPGAVNISPGQTAPAGYSVVPSLNSQGQASYTFAPSDSFAATINTSSNGSLGGYTTGVPTTSGNSPIYSAPTTLSSGSSRNSSEMFSSNLSGASTTQSAGTISNSPGAISVPSAPGYSNPGTINNGGLIAGLTDQGMVHDPASNSFSTPPTPTVSPEEQKRIDEQRKLMDMLPQQDSVLNSPEIQAQQAEVNQRKQEVANYTSQLNSVVAQQNVDLLRLRGIGAQEGVTETVYGGQAATINREAAIKALPIQAQIAAAQGNQALAQDYLTQLTTWKQEEISNRYEYKKAMYSSISEFVKGEQKIRLDAIKQKDDRAYEMSKTNLALQGDLLKAVAKDNPAIISRIAALNPSSPNFRADMSKIVGTIKTGGGGSVSATTQAIINNPSLFDDLTPTVRGQVLTELQTSGYDTSNLGLKGLSDTAIQSVSQTQKALDDLGVLKSKIQGNEDKLGPITGLAALNPWSESRKIQADIDRVRQTVGKALEGGVLRKEDEEKYKKILSTLTDTPSTAYYKIDALIGSITRDIENYKSLQQSSGRSLDVGASLQKAGSTNNTVDLRTKYNY